jgi:FKBP-type peptidyl-prolyl cis-trans isomerase FklB
MKKLIVLALSAAIWSHHAMALTEDERIAYTLGYTIGLNLKKQQAEDVDLDMLMNGIKESLNTPEKPMMTEEEVRAELINYHQKRTEKQQAARKAEADKQLKVAEEFLAENAKKEGVKTLPSGLQYKVIESGEGKTPGLEDTVTTHYRGTFIDGSEFDSSYSRGTPATFPVKGVIAGWTQALQMMKEGDKWQLFIPPQLGYGERGAPPKVPGNSALIFDIELISVEKKAAEE